MYDVYVFVHVYVITGLFPQLCAQDIYINKVEGSQQAVDHLTGQDEALELPQEEWLVVLHPLSAVFSSKVWYWSLISQM